MIEQLQPPQKMLRAMTDERNDLSRAKKPTLVNQPDDFTVSLGQLNRSNQTGAFESGKAGEFHGPTVGEAEQTKKASGFALLESGCSGKRENRWPMQKSFSEIDPEENGPTKSPSQRGAGLVVIRSSG